MKSMSIVWVCLILSCTAMSQTVYKTHMPCGSLRYYGLTGVAEAVWSRSSDTSAELSFTDLKSKMQTVVAVEISPDAELLLTGQSEMFEKMEIDLRNETILRLKLYEKAGQEPISLALPACPSSKYIPVNYECFNAVRSIYYNAEEGKDSVQMVIDHVYPVPAPGIPTDDSLRFCTAVLSIFDQTTVDIVYPDDVIKIFDIQYIQDYTSMYESGEAEVSDVFSNWEVYDALTVLFQKNNLMGLISAGYDYTGGAHGNYGASNYVYDFEAGKLLSLEDIFSINYEQTLEAAINREIRAEFELADDASLADNGFFVEVVPVTQNFMLSESEITFHYNIYEVAAYAVGSITVSIPYSDLSDIISEDGPVGRMME